MITKAIFVKSGKFLCVIMFLKIMKSVIKRAVLQRKDFLT